MGKQRRKRTKYHFTSEKKNDDEINTTIDTPEVDTEVSGLNVDIPENLFNNIKIDVDEVNTKLDNDDSKSIRSVKSISKSIKSIKKSLGDVHLKKADKRTLRRDLFLKKIQVTYDELKNKKKGANVLSISEMDKMLPSVNMVFHKAKTNKEIKFTPINTPKIRGIAKAKDRKKAMINNMDIFKKLLVEAKIKANPLDAITDSIQQKVLNEEL